MSKYSEGIYGDGAAIFKDGRPMTVSEIIAELNTRTPSALPDAVALLDRLAKWCDEQPKQPWYGKTAGDMVRTFMASQSLQTQPEAARVHDGLQRDYDRSQVAMREIVAENKRLAAENSELKTSRFRRFNNDECWIYDPIEDNHLESLVCPVVISPAELIRIVRISEVLPTLPDAMVEAAPHQDTGDTWDESNCAKWLRRQIEELISATPPSSAVSDGVHT